MSMQAMASFLEKTQGDEVLAENFVDILANNEGDEITSKVIDLAKVNGFDITASDVEETRKQFEQVTEAGDGELSDDDLENVSGGVVVSATVAAAIITGVAGVGAAGIGAAGALGSAVIKNGINNTVNDIGNFFSRW